MRHTAKAHWIRAGAHAALCWLALTASLALGNPGGAAAGDPGGVTHPSPVVSTGSARSVERLSQYAHRIVRGRHVESESRWEPRSRMIVTSHRIEVLETLKGEARAEATVVVPGGQLPEYNLQLTVPHQAQFRSSEEVLVFLADDAAGNEVVLAGAFGKFTVQRDPAGNAFVQRVPLGAVRDRVMAAVRVMEVNR